jgi:hypothetical protein
MQRSWQSAVGLSPRRFSCGLCGELISSALGFHFSAGAQGLIYICPNCCDPTFFDNTDKQIPGPIPGNKVEHLPKEIGDLYLEARNCVGVGSCTSAVLTCRKLLMHIAVAQGASEGESFISYVNFRADKGYVPPNGRGWVDHIRDKGNEANHEIKLMAKSDAEELISFLEMLLKFIYEFPNRVPAKSVITNV